MRTVEPVASSLARELTKYNWFGRTLLHQREGNELKLLVQSKMLALRMEMREIDETQEMLKKEKEEMEATVKLYLGMQEELKVARETQQRLRKEVDETKQHPVVNKAMQFHAKSTTTTERPSSTTPLSADSQKQRTPSMDIPQIPLERPPILIRPPLNVDEKSNSGDSSDDEIGKGLKDQVVKTPEDPMQDGKEQVEES
jgi:hypothetical protein